MIASLALCSIVFSQAPPFHFRGGGVQDLAAAIAEYTGEPCAILMPDPAGTSFAKPPTLRKATITPSAENPRESFLKGLNREFGLVAVEKSANAFSFGYWPLRAVRPYWREGEYSPPGQKAIVEDAEGRLTIRLGPGEAIPISKLGAYLRLRATVSGHWFYQKLAVAVAADRAEKDALVDLIAQAVGAKVIRSDLGIELAFDPAEFGKRAAETFERLARDVPSMREKFRFEAEAFRTIPLDVLSEAYKTEHSSVTWPVKPDSKLWALALEAARSLPEEVREKLNPERGIEYEVRAWDSAIHIRMWSGNTRVVF